MYLKDNKNDHEKNNSDFKTNNFNQFYSLNISQISLWFCIAHVNFLPYEQDHQDSLVCFCRSLRVSKDGFLLTHCKFLAAIPMLVCLGCVDLQWGESQEACCFKCMKTNKFLMLSSSTTNMAWQFSYQSYHCVSHETLKYFLREITLVKETSV